MHIHILHAQIYAYTPRDIYVCIYIYMYAYVHILTTPLDLLGPADQRTMTRGGGIVK